MGDGGRPVTATALPLGVFRDWLEYGERGASSEAIVNHLTGAHVGGWGGGRDWPRDPSDFRRCQLLCECVPLARQALPAMASRSPEWTRLVAAWDAIHALIESEVPGYLTNSRGGQAPRSYLLMARVIAGGAECDSCTGTGRSHACLACKGSGRRGGGRCRAAGCHHGYASCPTCRGYGYVRATAGADQ